MNSVIVANILKNLKLSYYMQNKIRKFFLEDGYKYDSYKYTFA